MGNKEYLNIMHQDISFVNITGIIFDYGGTLDSGGNHWSEVIWEAWQRAGMERYAGKTTFRDAYVFAERELARVRHILPEDDFYTLLLKKMQIELQWLADHSDFPPSLLSRKSEEIAGYCDQSARHYVAEADKVLKVLAEKYPLVLVSNFYGNIESVLSGYGLRQYFDKIIESAVVGVRKPDPAIFQLGVDALGMPAENVLVVGDSYKKDIEPALSAGCRAVWIKGKGWTSEEDTLKFDPTITNIKELLQLLNL